MGAGGAGWDSSSMLSSLAPTVPTRSGDIDRVAAHEFMVPVVRPIRRPAIGSVRGSLFSTAG
jgi:hypothetical protein